MIIQFSKLKITVFNKNWAKMPKIELKTPKTPLKTAFLQKNKGRPFLANP